MKVCECASVNRRPRPGDPLRCDNCRGWIATGARPDPAIIRRAAGDAQAAAGRVLATFGVAYDSVHSPATAERVGGSSTISNPTLNVVADLNRQRGRVHLIIAARLVERAARALVDAAGALDDALELTDSHRRDDEDQHTVVPFAAGAHPRIVEHSAIVSARDAQSRRHARGEY